MSNRTFAILASVLAIYFGTNSAAAQQKAAHVAVAKGASAAAVDVMLDGADWRMGSFDFGAGLKAGADKESFDDTTFKAVSVPGDTQLQAGLTGEARWGNSKELISVNAHEWWYRKHFHAGAKVAGTVTRIVFDGVDYFTTVWLNGELLGKHEGTYPEFSFDVTNKLRYRSDNVLAVEVTHPWIPPDGRGSLEYLNGGFSLYYHGFGLELKKPPYYIAGSWDALPAQGTSTYDMGIWRSVHLRTSAPVTISDLHVETERIDADGSATLKVGVTLDNARPETVTRTVALKMTGENFTGQTPELTPLTVTAPQGESKAEVEVKVPQAQLWWSWDHGPQNLYRLTASTASAKGAWGDRRTVVFGIRTIRRDGNMAYWLNGKKIFIRSSFFPVEDFYRSTPKPEDYERDLQVFRDGNFNMTVSFAVIEKPEFYDLCDRLGILIATQLPFSQFGGFQLLDRDNPRREPFLKQARLQVSQLVTALRNHPSIVEWTPLAEAHDKVTNRWGPGGTGVDQQGYEDFVAQMKAIVVELAPGTVFHPSLCDLGEEHFWYTDSSFEYGTYQAFLDAKTGFVSEYGHTSMSSVENMGKYLTPAQQWGIKTNAPRWFNLPIDATAYSYLTSYDVNGLNNMLFYTEHYVDGDPRSVAELVSDTQLFQGFVLKYAAEAFRRKKYEPINGIRSWDFVELNPGFHYGIVDYDRVPKLGYYYIKQAQAPLAVSFAFRDALESQAAGSKWAVPVWVVNDTDSEVRGTVHAELLATNGEKAAAADFPVVVAADGNAAVGEFGVTLPEKAGVYMLRASLAGAPVETSFIKVVPPAFSGTHRVLVIAQAKYAAPIAKSLRAMGLGVDVYDENSLDAMQSELANAAHVHAKYDAIWIGNFDALAKVLPRETAEAIDGAVKAGSGFVITGGFSSFHGGLGRAAVVEGTALDPILPVEIAGRSDVHLVIDKMGSEWSSPAENRSVQIRAIAGGSDGAESGISAQGSDLLRQYGLAGYNEVTARTGSRTGLTISGDPLLVTGRHGAGKTVAFMGFTPAEDAASSFSFDQYLIASPQAQGYFVTFADLIADILPGGEKRNADLLDAHVKPLFQTLKEEPKTDLAVTKVADLAAGSRVRIENGSGYAHLVHLRYEWAGTKPFLAEMSDNDFELLPNESREIELTWRYSGVVQQSGGSLVVNGANAAEVRLAF